jgi:hypothetical protein
MRAFIGGAMGCLLTIVIQDTQQDKQSSIITDTIEAKQVLVRGDNDKSSLMLGLRENQPFIVLRDSTGAVRLHVGLLDNSGTIALDLRDRHATRLSLASTHGSGCGMHIYDQQEHRVGTISHVPGRGTVVAAGPEDKPPFVALWSRADGSAHVNARAGDDLVELVCAFGGSSVQLSNAGRRGVRLENKRWTERKDAVTSTVAVYGGLEAPGALLQARGLETTMVVRAAADERAVKIGELRPGNIGVALMESAVESRAELGLSQDRMARFLIRDDAGKVVVELPGR